MSKNKLKPRCVVLLVVMLLVLDQVTKILVKTNMSLGEHFSVFGDWFYIYFIENEGAAYGMKIFSKLFLSLFRIGAIVGIIYYLTRLFRDGAPRGVLIAFAFILAGAVGNVLDSAFYGLIFSESTSSSVATLTSFGEGYTSFLHGNVVDMLYFPIIEIEQMPDWVPFIGGEPYTFFSPIFNVADSYLTCSVLYLIIFQRKFFSNESSKKAVKQN